jgi:Alpha/beta hydrolase of unknown function (DUF900)/PhoD-like phosphatase
MKIAFTSCMDASRVSEQPIWVEIKNAQPDVLMLLGDQIYMDWGLSSSDNPKWLKRIRKDGKKALQEFGRDMHARYAAQWAIASFRDLIRWFVPLHGRDQLFMCWDDHDFAWNNACGMGRPDSAATPIEVKTISKALFQQFREHLATGYTSDIYPAYPDAHLLPVDAGAGGIEYFAPTPINTVRIACLDQRWYRYPRNEVPSYGQFPTLLGSSQWSQIELMLAQSQGLNIIASGLPMRHKYRFSHQSWSEGEKANEPAYPDYDRMLRTVNKPTLYLCGDIHKNEAVGLLNDSTGKQNPHLFHLASSGAAISNALWVKFEPSFGLLDIDSAAKTVDVRLKQLKNGAWRDEFTQKLSYASETWQASVGQLMPTQNNVGNNPAEALAAMKKIDEAEPELGILCARQLRTDLASTALPFDLDRMDELYSDNTLSSWPGSEPGSAYPDAVTIVPATRKIHISHASSANAMNSAIALMGAALERAKTNNKKSIVLFVHGFNNGFVQSVEQAFELRQMYAIEPVLLSWPGGEVSPILLDAGSDAIIAHENASRLPSSLVIALKALEHHQAKYPEIKRILALRSYGAVALEQLIASDVWKANGNDQSMNGLHSVVLSAPALATKKLDDWIKALPVPLRVIGNRNDKALKLGYKLIHKSWDALGCTVPTRYFSEKHNYFDCTDFPGVNNKHNIITEPGVDPQVSNLHASLLTGEFSPSNAPTGFVKLTTNIWTKS